ncbi:MAG: glycosyltransferase family 4 protein [Candidatus Omnitrophica bacterium]|nr:glycosyltransferase family 4 protein [Candidatus Omnitrophota bacterium]
MKIIFLTPYPLGKGPNVRFRLECYLPYLKKEGIQYVVRSFSSGRFYGILYKRGYFWQKCFYTFWGYLKRFFHFWESLRYDVICVLREVTPLGPAVTPFLWRFFGKKVIFDFDDAIYLKNMNQVNRMVACLKFPSKTGDFARWSRRVIAGNQHLAKYARQYNPNVSMIPTPIDTGYFLKEKENSRNREEICIGWAGSWTTLPHFYLVKEELKILTRRHPSVRVKIFGTRVANIPGVPLEALDWSLESELAQLRGFDIGIMPLPDDEWSRGKCGFKLLMYMALGIPTVSSPVGVNTEIIKDGENGFLAASGEEWIKKLSLLIADPSLRQRIAAAGRKTVEEKYSVARWGPEFVKALQEN